jgi:hypothetical protein
MHNISILWADNKNDEKLDERYRAAKLAVAASKTAITAASPIGV